ncbi:hypothetical protein NEOKW01_2114 [Nematocida sp. AWRm80]|nr:hypothetical protein NEOKW01_2114 [Nematocida sp. AWRm80]
MDPKENAKENQLPQGPNDSEDIELSINEIYQYILDNPAVIKSVHREVKALEENSLSGRRHSLSSATVCSRLEQAKKENKRLVKLVENHQNGKDLNKITDQLRSSLYEIFHDFLKYYPDVDSNKMYKTLGLKSIGISRSELDLPSDEEDSSHSRNSDYEPYSD